MSEYNKTSNNNMFINYGPEFADVYSFEGEEILWVGKPNPEKYVHERKLELPKLVVVTFVGSTILYFFTMNSAMYIFGCCLCLFLGIPATIMINRSISPPDWTYLVTNKRLLSDYPTEDNDIIWQLDLKGISSMHINRMKGGGTITFRSRSGYRNPIVQFQYIEHPDSVVAIIDKAIRDVSNSSER